MATKHYHDPLSAFTAACALTHETGERWMVVTVGMGWKLVYATCAKDALPVITQFAQYCPERFDAFPRHRAQRNKYWDASQVSFWAGHHPCLVCGLGPANHQEVKTVLT